VGLLAALLVARSPADVTLLRNVGRPFVVGGDGLVENTLRLKVTNRTDRPQRYRLSVASPADVRAELTGADTLAVGPGESVTEPLRVFAPAGRFTGGHLDVTLRLAPDEAGAKPIDRRWLLLGPAAAAPQPAATSTRGSNP
jgi:hypothetical protein